MAPVTVSAAASAVVPQRPAPRKTQGRERNGLSMPRLPGSMKHVDPFGGLQRCLSSGALPASSPGKRSDRAEEFWRLRTLRGAPSAMRRVGSLSSTSSPASCCSASPVSSSSGLVAGRPWTPQSVWQANTLASLARLPREHTDAPPSPSSQAMNQGLKYANPQPGHCRVRASPIERKGPAAESDLGPHAPLCSFRTSGDLAVVARFGASRAPPSKTPQDTEVLPKTPRSGGGADFGEPAVASLQVRTSRLPALDQEGLADACVRAGPDEEPSGVHTVAPSVREPTFPSEEGDLASACQVAIPDSKECFPQDARHPVGRPRSCVNSARACKKEQFRRAPSSFARLPRRDICR
mmetsp:Transcript_77207/g.223433  ORF Transcript_77207/g.223433 Transcript_77207/m.223433 type:complete len:351 (-) Transcript_77207:183-1235(-)